AMQFHRLADMKFRLQIHRVEVPVPSGTLVAHDAETLLQTFADKYEALYGKGSAFKEAGGGVGVLRTAACGKNPRPRLALQMQNAADAIVGSRDVYWREMRRFVATPIYTGITLAARMKVEGPAVIEMPETTIVLRPK